MSRHRDELPDEQERREAAERWRTLPAVVPVENMVALQPVQEAKDPDAGRDPNHDWMIKHG